MLRLWKNPEELEPEEKAYFKEKFATATNYTEREQKTAQSILNTSQERATCMAKYMEELDRDTDAVDLVAGTANTMTADLKKRWDGTAKKYEKDCLGNSSWCHLSAENSTCRQGGALMKEQFCGLSHHEIRDIAEDAVFHRSGNFGSEKDVRRPEYLDHDHADREHAIKSALVDIDAWKALYGQVCAKKPSW